MKQKFFALIFSFICAFSAVGETSQTAGSVVEKNAIEAVSSKPEKTLTDSVQKTEPKTST